MTAGLIASLQIQPGNNEQFEHDFIDMQKAFLENEPGCTQFELFRAVGDDSLYYVLEQYRDEHALAHHNASLRNPSETIKRFRRKSSDPQASYHYKK